MLRPAAGSQPLTECEVAGLHRTIEYGVIVADFVGTASVSPYGLADAELTVRTWPCAKQVIQRKYLNFAQPNSTSHS